MREVTLVEIQPTPGLPAGSPPVKATVVKVSGRTAYVRHTPGMPRTSPWTMPVDRKTGMPAKGSDWAWRVSDLDLPL